MRAVTNHTCLSCQSARTQRHSALISCLATRFDKVLEATSIVGQNSGKEPPRLRTPHCQSLLLSVKGRNVLMLLPQTAACFNLLCALLWGGQILLTTSSWHSQCTMQSPVCAQVRAASQGCQLGWLVCHTKHDPDMCTHQRFLLP